MIFVKKKKITFGGISTWKVKPQGLGLPEREKQRSGKRRSAEMGTGLEAGDRGGQTTQKN